MIYAFFVVQNGDNLVRKSFIQLSSTIINMLLIKDVVYYFGIIIYPQDNQLNSCEVLSIIILFSL